MALNRRYNLQQKTPELMGHYLFWIPWSLFKKMEVCQPPYTESPRIQPNICSGTATIPLPTSTVVINSLLHRATNICSNQEQVKEELKYVEIALTACKYPSWAIQRMMLKKNNTKTNSNNNRTNRNNNNSRTSITVPYNKGLSEGFKNIGKKFGIQVHFKSGRTIKEELVAPKDKDHITKKSRVIYRFKCGKVGMWWRVHWWNIKNLWRDIQRTP